MQRKFRKTLILSVKVLVALVLLGWVLSKVHWGDYTEIKDGEEFVRMGFASTIANIRPGLLTIAVFGFVLSLLIIAVRWWLLLRLQEIRIRLWEAVRLTFLGQFFNAVVPGTVGGDLVKAYYVSRHTSNKPAVLVSVFVDRVLGLTELNLLGGVMVGVVWFTGRASYAEIRLPLITVVIVAVITTLALVFVLSSRFRRTLHLQKLYRGLSIARHIEAMGEAAALYRKRIRYLFHAVLMTFGAHIVWVTSIAFIGWSLSLSVPWYSYFIYIPLIYIIGAVPVTPGGIGLVEQFYLVFFVCFVANPSEVLGLALLARLIPMFWGLPGAVVAVTGPKLPKRDTLQMELGLEPENPS